MRTTIGQVMANKALPSEYRDYNRVLSKGETDKLLERIIAEHPEQYKKISHALVQLGRNAAYEEGTTLHLSDLQSGVDKTDFFKNIAKQEAVIDHDKTMTVEEKQDARELLYGETQDAIKKLTYEDALAHGNPFAMQVKSKARGNQDQLVSLMSTPGTYQDSSGKTVPIFIRHSHAEGLDPHEYWGSMAGARLGVVSTKFCLALGTEVLMADYSVRPIEAVQVGEEVFTISADDKLITTKVTGVFANGLKECSRYEFGSGKSIRRIIATKDHKILGTNKDTGLRTMYRLEDTKTRSFSAALPSGADGGVYESRAGVLGVLPGDGGLTTSTTNIFVSEPELADWVKDEAPNRYAIYKRHTDVGLLNTFDIEVAHPSHCFVLANGLIVSNSTRKAGYLGKLLASAVMDNVVTESDCETPYGIPVKADDDDNIGSVLARPAAGFTAGTVIDKGVLATLQKNKIADIVVRSPITCGSKDGVCKQCVGMRESGKFPQIGYHVGVNAASAMAEQIATASLSVKHSGKKAKGLGAYSGFDMIKNLATIPSTYPDRATVSEIDGIVDKIEAAPQGGFNITVSGQDHYVPRGYELMIKEGDHVEPGDQLSDGVLNPADVVRLKGLGEGRRYFAERLTRAFKDSNFGVNRRNVEAITRSVINHVQVDDEGAAGTHLPGDVVTYGAWAYGYKPRADAKRLVPKAALGQYLEEPALHYTIGTHVTKSMSDLLQKNGINDVLAHPQPVGVHPVMQSVVKTPEFSDDWMARLSSSYLKTRLLEDAQTGATSNVHGVNPMPGIAMGTEFGQQKGKTFTY